VATHDEQSVPARGPKPPGAHTASTRNGRHSDAPLWWVSTVGLMARGAKGKILRPTGLKIHAREPRANSSSFAGQRKPLARELLDGTSWECGGSAQEKDFRNLRGTARGRCGNLPISRDDRPGTASWNCRTPETRRAISIGRENRAGAREVCGTEICPGDSCNPRELSARGPRPFAGNVGTERACSLRAARSASGISLPLPLTGILR
jgi:hypothetical protein